MARITVAKSQDSPGYLAIILDFFIQLHYDITKLKGNDC